MAMSEPQSSPPSHDSDIIRAQDLETMSREMDLWVRDAQVQQQRYDDERRKTDVELEPLMIKLQVVHVLRVSVLAQCAAYVIALFSQRALRLRERSRRNIGCRLLQRALPAPGMKRFCFSFFAEYQTSINKYSDCSTPPAREVDDDVKCAANFTARRHCRKGSNC